MMWIVLTAAVLAQDVDGNGCVDAYEQSQSSCVHPTAEVGAAEVGSFAVVGPYVGLADDVLLGSRASLDGSSSGTELQWVLGPTTIGRRTAIGADASIGSNNTWSRSVQTGSRLTSESGVSVGYAATLGNDVTLRSGAVVGSLVQIGDYTTLEPSAILARGVVVSASLSSKPASLGGVVGPGVTIGKGVQMASSVRVRKDAVIGDDAVLNEGVRVGRDAVVEAGAVLGRNVSLAAGARVLAGAVVPDGYRVVRNEEFAPVVAPSCDVGFTGAACDEPMCVICVDADASEGGDGTCWTNPTTDLSAALVTAGDSPHQSACLTGVSVWVAEGLYTPSPSDRDQAFEIQTGVRLLGGFDGTETTASQRDPASHATILSGDLAGDDGPGFTNRADNAHNVVRFPRSESSATLDGVTVQGGAADIDNSFRGEGGGIRIDRGAPVLRNLVIRDNQSMTPSGGYNGGGGLYAYFSSFTLTDSLFEGNRANALTSYAGGGAAYLFGSGDVTIERTVFRGNHVINNGGAYRGGGALFARSSSGSDVGSTRIVDSIFQGNDGGEATHQYAGGGAILHQARKLDVVNTAFIGNTIGLAGRGGAAYLMFSEESDPCSDAWEACMTDPEADPSACDDAYFSCSEPGVLLTPISFTNCTFVGNDAYQGGALYFFQTGSYDSPEPTDQIVNSVFASNTATDSTVGQSSADLSVTYSCLADHPGGDGNIAGCSPTFVDAAGLDGVYGTADDDVRLAPGSPGVDAGLSSAPGLFGITTDLDGSNRFNGTVDMGAYER